MNKCDICGKFIKYGTGDCGTRYGCSNPSDPEPHDPDYWCDKCSEKYYNKAIEQGDKMQLYWEMPNWQQRALKALGLKK